MSASATRTGLGDQLLVALAANPDPLPAAPGPLGDVFDRMTADRLIAYPERYSHRRWARRWLRTNWRARSMLAALRSGDAPAHRDIMVTGARDTDRTCRLAGPFRCRPAFHSRRRCATSRQGS